jgi:nicotinamide phosphoribosyltransferase
MQTKMKSKICNSMLMTDFYKISHKDLYPKDIEIVYSTWTPRKSRMEGVNEVVVFGFQWFVKAILQEHFNEHFFNRPLDEVLDEYKRVIKYTLGINEPDCSHIKELHELGYLPLKIDALEEGTLCPIRVPALTIYNTDKRFFWLTNFIETLFSTCIWKPMTSATIAREYRKILDKWADKTCDDNLHVDFQAHDFSMRGMSCIESAETSGAAHLLSFLGTDTIPAILFHENYYGADIEKETVGTSIPASEHSVMECGESRDEYEMFKYILTEVHPKGYVSVVSDTWNLWEVLISVLPRLKDVIMQRDGKLVVRPDSGNPCDIICGKPDVEEHIAYMDEHGYIQSRPNDYYEQEKKGVVELLWEEFGGTINSKGYKVLDSHIGVIYGDAITLERAEEICRRLEAKGFASSNVVFGIGSYTYQMNTRDTFGFALKTTYCQRNGGKEIFLFKDPITDDGEKKSQMGMVAVYKYDNEGKEEIHYTDKLLMEDLLKYSGSNLLKPLFHNGELLRETTLSKIRYNLKRV